jgi:hypothetical protein
MCSTYVAGFPWRTTQVLFSLYIWDSASFWSLLLMSLFGLQGSCCVSATQQQGHVGYLPFSGFATAPRL